MVLLGRFGVAKIGLALLFVLATGYAFAAAVSIANTKHNFAFGGAGTGTIKAKAGEGPMASEICKFCHTPHAAMIAQPLPLWNKQLTEATYTTYTSDYLTSLGYPTAAPFTPGQSSRTCLSCHDGTVAIGAVYNVKGTTVAGTIKMVDGALDITTMPVGKAGYLGTNLADDHPVGYEYNPGGAYPPVPGQTTDPELLSYAAGPGSGGVVKLDPNTSAGKVECKSCHDPHDDQYKKFLRASNVNGALCKLCHNKTGYGGSGHDTGDATVDTYQQAATADPQLRDTVQKYSCLACHRPHNGQTLPLLRGVEEATCFNAGCHGSLNPIAGNTTQTMMNIEGEYGALKLHKHPTVATSGKHKDIPGGETVTQLGGIIAINRHAECYDCHNPHQVLPTVLKTLAARGNLRISAALKGTWGVKPKVWAVPPTAMTDNKVSWATPANGDTGYDRVSGAALTDEYMVCLKCHSNYVTLPAGVRNLAQEINPGNSSYHGIVPITNPTFTVANQLSNATNFYVNQVTMAQPWAGNTDVTSATNAETCRTNPNGALCLSFAASRGRVWCSDCHGSQATTVTPGSAGGAKAAPYGPHGSTLNNALTVTSGAGTIVTSNSDKMLIATIASTTQNTPLCLKCHGQGTTAGVYTTAVTGSRMSQHNGGNESGIEGCFFCHMWENSATTPTGSMKIYPHGMNKKWTKYPDGVATPTQHMADSFVGGWYTNIDYVNKLCWTVNSGGAVINATACGRTHAGDGY